MHGSVVSRGTMAAATGRVNVFSRVRPGVAREDGDQHCVTMIPDDRKCVVRLHDGDAVERVLAGGSVSVKTVEKEYTFDGVFDGECTQREVYEEVGKPVLKDVLQGYNGSILAYGQTGAGKTHSLLNPGMGIDGKPDPKQAGLLPRLVAALFVHIGADLRNVYTVEASMLQIYNENIDCLLGEDREKAAGLQVSGKSEIRGLTWAPCATPHDLLRCFTRGRANLVYAETKMNKTSSRSHAVFQIKVAKRPRATDKASGVKGAAAVEMKATFGKLTVVDLAGSERVKKSGVSGVQLKEASNINSSLLAFGNIVQALAEKKKFVPYRDSKLTRILEDSVGGNCKTSLLVCCSPSSESSDETVSTLEFASRAARIETTATINEGVVTVDAASLIADLAGDGLDTALREKHTQMMALETKLKCETNKRDAELLKMKDEAAKKQQVEATKASEASKLVDKWRVKAEEAGRRISQLETAVVEAAGAKEAKAGVAKAEREVAALRNTLAVERAEASKLADAAAGDLRAQITATQKLLDESNALAQTLEGRTSDAEHLVVELRTQLDASMATLDAAGADAAAAIAKAAEDNATALRAAEHNAVARAIAAAEAARVEAEDVAAAAVASARGALTADYGQRVDAAASAAADELAAVKATAAASAAARDGDIAALQATAAERAERVAALEEEAEALGSQILTARADLVHQRETAVAEAARLDAAHAGALIALDARRREEAAASALRLAEGEAKHAEEVRALGLRAAAHGKRLSWAFSASRSLLDDANAALARDHGELRARFDARESREDDVRAIAGLKQDVRLLEGTCAGLESETKQLTLRLENRNANDAVFGGGGSVTNRRTAGGSSGRQLSPKRVSVAAAVRPDAAAVPRTTYGPKDGVGFTTLKSQPMRHSIGGWGGESIPPSSSVANATFSRLYPHGMR